MTAIFGQGAGLVAVAVDAVAGPLVLLHGIELIARQPPQAREDVRELAHVLSVSVRTNHDGDPEAKARGLSLRAQQAMGLTPQGHVPREDTMITSALLVSPPPAADPPGCAPVVM